MSVCVLQVYLSLQGKVLVVTQDMLRNIPLLASAYSFGDPEESPVLELPVVKEYKKNGLDLLKSLFVFSLEESFQPPATHVELFSLIRLADYLGLDSFLTAAATWLGVSIDALLNHNPIRFVRGLVRGRYRASRHARAQKWPHICIYCYRPIDPPVPINIAAVTKKSPCCDKVWHTVEHQGSYRSSKPEC